MFCLMKIGKRIKLNSKMKHFIKLIAICFFVFLSANILAQKKLIDKRTRANLSTTKQVVRIDAQKQLKPYNQATRLILIGKPVPFVKTRSKRVLLPKKTIDLNRIEEGPEWGWGWIHKKKTS